MFIKQERISIILGYIDIKPTILRILFIHLFYSTKKQIREFFIF